MDDSVLRIGEVAHLAGVSTRTIRHYHHAGVLPEPPRMQNGYRRYGIRDVVLLLRVRRLVELGMSLDEVKDALAEPAGSDLREILVELDASLALQERRIAERRSRVADALALLDDDGADKQAVLARLAQTSGIDEAALRRESLAAHVIEATADPRLLPTVWSTYQTLLDETDVSQDLIDLNRRFDALSGLDPRDPAVDELASHAERLGDAVLEMLPPEIREGPGDPTAADRLLHTMQAGMDPAQARCLRLMFAAWKQASS